MMCKFVEKHLSHDSFSDGVKLAANYLTEARMCCLFFLFYLSVCDFLYRYVGCF